MSTILVFKRNLVDLFGQYSQQQQSESWGTLSVMLSQMRKIVSLLVFSVFLFSCKKEEKKLNILPKNIITEEIQKNGNITTIISTDINKLGKLINLSKFKPLKVKYKYVFIDNSNGRISGPSDSNLEAVIYFDNLTMQKIHEIDLTTNFPEPNFEKNKFKFNWLDKTILTELENSEKNKSAHPDFLFETNGKLWYLKDKILLSLITN